MRMNTALFLMLVLVASYCLLYQDCCRGSNRRILLVLCAILHSWITCAFLMIFRLTSWFLNSVHSLLKYVIVKMPRKYCFLFLNHVSSGLLLIVCLFRVWWISISELIQEENIFISIVFSIAKELYYRSYQSNWCSCSPFESI